MLRGLFARRGGVCFPLRRCYDACWYFVRCTLKASQVVPTSEPMNTLISGISIARRRASSPAVAAFVAGPPLLVSSIRTMDTISLCYFVSSANIVFILSQEWNGGLSFSNFSKRPWVCHVIVLFCLYHTSFHAIAPW